MPDDSWFDFTDWTPPPTPKVEYQEKLAEVPKSRTSWWKNGCYLCGHMERSGNIPRMVAYETCDIHICDGCMHLAAPFKW